MGMADVPRRKGRRGEDLATDEEISAAPEMEATAIARYGLRCGRLDLLADYLRQGYNLNDHIRGALIEAIEGNLFDGFYKPLRLQAKGRIGRRKLDSSTARFHRQLEIYQRYLAELPRCNGDTESAISATGEKFGVRRTTVTNAVTAVRQRLKVSQTDNLP
jgi:hypothetical protein